MSIHVDFFSQKSICRLSEWIPSWTPGVKPQNLFLKPKEVLAPENELPVRLNFYLINSMNELNFEAFDHNLTSFFPDLTFFEIIWLEMLTLRYQPKKRGPSFDRGHDRNIYYEVTQHFNPLK